jgi:hypothetical protein
VTSQRQPGRPNFQEYRSFFRAGRKALPCLSVVVRFIALSEQLSVNLSRGSAVEYLGPSPGQQARDREKYWDNLEKHRPKL